jgi:hypothetical protein
MLIQIDQASGFKNEKKRSSGLTFVYLSRGGWGSCKNEIKRRRRHKLITFLIFGINARTSLNHKVGLVGVEM